MSHPVICLMGPTASGKTDLALSLANQLPIDIISVDSAMIYRGMDIGTAKPERDILERVPHYLIDICDPKEHYSVGDFYRDAHAQIEKSTADERIPLLVGGTMMYFRTLQRGLAELPTADPIIRAELLTKAHQHGWEYLHQQLQKVDPTSASRIHPNDKQRISRALEVFYVSGKTISAHQAKTTQSHHLPYRWLALFPQDRTILHEIIASRFYDMLDKGLIAEIETLYARGDLSVDLPAIRSVNYAQVWEYLAGNITYDVMVERAIAATRQLAKRQMTWLRTFPSVEVLSGGIDELLQIY